MNTCDTCKYWKPTYRGCVPPENEPEVGSCGSPKFKKGYGEFVELPDEIVLEDDEGWSMECGPKFGCIHHANQK